MGMNEGFERRVSVWPLTDPGQGWREKNMIVLNSISFDCYVTRFNNLTNLGLRGTSETVCANFWLYLCIQISVAILIIFG